MGRKLTLNTKDAPAKERARKSIMLEQKGDMLWHYKRGELMAAIRNTLHIRAIVADH